MATRLEVTEQAFRLLGLKAEDQALSADEAVYGGDALDAILAEVEETHELGFTSANIPAAAVQALARLLAADIAPAYMRPAPVSRGAAWLRFMAVVRPDQRDVVEAQYF